MFLKRKRPEVGWEMSIWLMTIKYFMEFQVKTISLFFSSWLISVNFQMHLSERLRVFMAKIQMWWLHFVVSGWLHIQEGLSHPCLTGSNMQHAFFFFLNAIFDPNSRVLCIHIYKVPLFPSIWMSNNLRLSSNYHHLRITVVSLRDFIKQRKTPSQAQILKRQLRQCIYKTPGERVDMYHAWEMTGFSLRQLWE